MVFPRPLTDAEWNGLRPYFPALVRNQCMATAPATPVYNCISWTLGITNTWVNPPPTIPLFIGLYNSYGYIQCPANEALIDGWALNNVPTHGSIVYRPIPGKWESKLGANIRLEHERTALGPLGTHQSLYGSIIFHVKRRAHHVESEAEIAITQSLPDIPELEKIATTLKTAYEADDFAKKYGDWKKTWFVGKLQYSSLLQDRAQGPEWRALIEMGPSIIPKVVDILQNPQDEFAVIVYEKLQTDRRKLPSTEDPKQYYVLKNRAAQIRRLYHHAVLEPFLAKAGEWEVSSSEDAYQALLGIGKDEITPLVMAKYAENQDGRWHELLNELHTGKKVTGETIDKKQEYEKWKKWFVELRGAECSEEMWLGPEEEAPSASAA